jgi:hypothetical protein
MQQHAQRQRVEQAVEIFFGGKIHQARRRKNSITYGKEHNTSRHDPRLKISLETPGAIPKNASRVPIEAFFLHF